MEQQIIEKLLMGTVCYQYYSHRMNIDWHGLINNNDFGLGMQDLMNGTE